MKRNILDKFCEFLKKEVFEGYSAYSILTNLQYYFPQLKSEIISNILEYGDRKNLYLDIVKNDITNINNGNDISLKSLAHWFELFEIDAEMHTIMNGNINDKNIYNYLNSEYTLFDETTVKKSKQHVYWLQNDFAKYFSKIYAEEAIKYCKSMRKNTEDLLTSKSVSKPFIDKSLIKFLDSINDIEILDESTFTKVYEDVILFNSKNLESEILENLALLPHDKKNDYLDFVSHKIKKTPHYNTADTIIDKWLKKYKVDKTLFPYFKNSELSLVLEYNVDDDFFHPTVNVDFFDIQKDFFHYVAMLETNKIISFIDNLSFNRTNSNIIIENKSELNPIFKSIDAFNSFNSLLDHFDISKNNISKRGTQAKLNAIWSCPSSKKIIFKEHSELNEYVNYLNEIFKTSFKSRTMSDGSNYHLSIKEWLSQVK